MGNQFLKGLQRPAIMPEGSSLPDYSEANDGDALIIEDGEPTWGAVDGLPEIEESDEGKVLAVDQGEAVWADAPSGLPEITSSDEGKVLTVVEGSTYTVVGTVFPTQVFDFTETPDAIAQDSNLAYFTEGDTVRLTVGNSTYFATVIDDDGLVAEFSEGPISVIYEGTDEDQGYIKCGSRSGTGEVTAKLENVAADLEAQWAEPNGGEVEGIYSISLSSADGSTWTSDKTFAQILEHSHSVFLVTISMGGNLFMRALFDQVSTTGDPVTSIGIQKTTVTGVSAVGELEANVIGVMFNSDNSVTLESLAFSATVTVD